MERCDKCNSPLMFCLRCFTLFCKHCEGHWCGDTEENDRVEGLEIALRIEQRTQGDK